VLPDFASVNAHEAGAEAVATVLHDRGVGVEAGLWTPHAVNAYRAWRVPCIRLLLEVMEHDAAEAAANAHRMLDMLPASRPPVLLHSEGPAVWPILREALALRLDTRIGLEDTQTIPDGSPAPDNATLVGAAVRAGAS
jgi:uncharacterized protein (DUF849 family)